MHVVNHTDIKSVFLHKILSILYICIDVSTSSRNCWKRFICHIHIYCQWCKQKSPNSSTLNTNFSEKKYLSKHKLSPHDLFFSERMITIWDPVKLRQRDLGISLLKGIHQLHSSLMSRQKQVISQLLPLPHLSAGEGKLGSLGSEGVGGGRVCTFSYLGSWDMLWSTPVLQLRHSLSSYTALSLQPGTVNPEEKQLWKAIPAVISSVLPTNFYTRTSCRNVGQIHAFSFTAYFYNPPFLKIPMQCKTTCFNISAKINKHSSLSINLIFKYTTLLHACEK